jgi:hypothetical protein
MGIGAGIIDFDYKFFILRRFKVMGPDGSLYLVAQEDAEE